MRFLRPAPKVAPEPRCALTKIRSEGHNTSGLAENAGIGTVVEGHGFSLVPQVRAPVLGANLGEGKSEALLRAPSVPGLALSTPIRSLRSQSPETHNGGSCSTSNPRGLKLAHVSPDFDE